MIWIYFLALESEKEALNHMIYFCFFSSDLHLYGCILLASCLIQAITSAPTTPPPTPARWHSPCAGQTINSFDSLNAAVQTASASLTTMDNAVHYRNIHISALETKVLVASLKAHYVSLNYIFSKLLSNALVY